MTKLQKYDFQLIHKPGNSQRKVDTLSHRPDHTQGKNDQILLREEQFRNIITQESEFWKEVEETKEFIEEEVRGTVEQQEKGWKQEGKVLLWKKKIYVPDSATL